MILQRLALRAAVACALLASTPACADGVGRASFYGYESGRVTANGELFDPLGMTAAHWTMPFGARVRVTDVATGRSVVVRINDRGPHPRLHRLIDLSLGAARVLGITGRGVVAVRLTRLPR